MCDMYRFVVTGTKRWRLRYQDQKDKQSLVGLCIDFIKEQTIEKWAKRKDFERLWKQEKKERKTHRMKLKWGKKRKGKVSLGISIVIISSCQHKSSHNLSTERFEFFDMLKNPYNSTLTHRALCPHSVMCDRHIKRH